MVGDSFLYASHNDLDTAISDRSAHAELVQKVAFGIVFSESENPKEPFKLRIIDPLEEEIKLKGGART